jgi:hypothetical protein
MDDPFRPSLAKFAKLGHTFLIPWTSEPITIMAGFESARLQSIEGPLVLESPFDMTDVKLVTMLHELSGSSNSYDDAFSSRTEQNSEDMSMAGALSVGCPILKGEVSGKYSKTIKESKDVSESVHATSLLWAQRLTEMHRTCGYLDRGPTELDV